MAMDKDELAELAENPEFISGIYNYCDRWCERCQFTSRCFLYATEQADSDLDDPEVRDIRNEKFWTKLQSIFKNTAEMITQWAAEAGLDLDSIDTEEALEEHKREIDKAKQSELSQAAKRYAMTVETWFKEEFATEEDVHDDAAITPKPNEMDLTVREAAEVIRWYQFFVAVKIFRALTGGDRTEYEPDGEDDIFGNIFDDGGPGDDDDIDYEAVLARADWMDANGSAKVALVAIDRSISAWRVLQISLPEKAGSIQPMLLELERLRRATELRFPQARDFIRPGLDESTSTFVS
jgi:hypothetical protein